MPDMRESGDTATLSQATKGGEAEFDYSLSEVVIGGHLDAVLRALDTARRQIRTLNEANSSLRRRIASLSKNGEAAIQRNTELVGEAMAKDRRFSELDRAHGLLNNAFTALREQLEKRDLETKLQEQIIAELKGKIEKLEETSDADLWRRNAHLAEENRRLEGQIERLGQRNNDLFANNTELLEENKRLTEECFKAQQRNWWDVALSTGPSYEQIRKEVREAEMAKTIENEIRRGHVSSVLVNQWRALSKLLEERGIQHEENEPTPDQEAKKRATEQMVETMAAARRLDGATYRGETDLMGSNVHRTIPVDCIDPPIETADREPGIFSVAYDLGKKILDRTHAAHIALDEYLMHLKVLSDIDSSREISLAITNGQQSGHWLEEHSKQR